MKSYGLKPLPLLACAFLILLFSCQKNLSDNSSSASVNGSKDIQPKELKDFVQVNLVADNSSFSPQIVDPNLVNPRSFAFSSTGTTAFVPLQDVGTAVRFTIDGHSAGSPLTIPSAPGGGSNQLTGIACNLSSDFVLADGNPAQLIFVSADGSLSGWNGSCGISAVGKVDAASEASNYSVTIANNGVSNFIYAANFAQNKIEVYNSSWASVNMPFNDPNLPAGYSPINIASISDGKLFVTYAKKNSSGSMEAGNGNGYVNVFSPNGILLQRFASAGKLNIPYAVVKAPAEFWGWPSTIQNMILVGNAGDGHINVFDQNGNYMGQLSAKGSPVEIDGLWGMAFPPVGAYNYNYLYFTAGPSNHTHGIYGYLKSKSLN